MNCTLFLSRPLSFCALALTLAAGFASQSVCAQEPQKVIEAGSQASKSAGTKNFTGAVRLDPGFVQTAPARVYGTYVTFEPGARTFWHIHPMGQTLVVTAGKGWTQEAGQPRQTVRTGDVVICPPGVKHWHGATDTTAMTHLSISERVKDKGAVWLDRVTDEEFLGTKK